MPLTQYQGSTILVGGSTLIIRTLGLSKDKIPG